MKKAKERAQYSRRSETKQQREIRLEKQRQRSQANRIKKALERSLSNRPNTQQENITVESNETQYSEPINTSKLHSFTNNENIDIVKNSISSNSPEPISRNLKEDCLQEFIRKTSMSELSESARAVCNVRTSLQKSKKLPVSKIPHAELLKVSDMLKNLINTSQSSTMPYTEEPMEILESGSVIQVTRASQGNLQFQ